MIYRVKKFDDRATDFLTGRKVSPSRDEWKTCSCCGQKIVKGWEMSNGHVVGEDCENIISRFAAAEKCFGETVDLFCSKWEQTCGKMKNPVRGYLEAV